MGWSGGTFSRTHNFSADASAGIQAQATRFDAEFDNYKTGLETCVTRDGQNAATGDLPMGGNKHTGVGAATSAQEYLRADQNTQQTGIYLVGAVSGRNFSASATVFPTALSEGMRICAQSSSGSLVGGSATASTVNIIVNGLTAPVLNDRGKYPLGQTVLPAGNFKEFIYSSADSAWRSLRPIDTSASVNLMIASYNESATAWTGSVTCPAHFRRSGGITVWNVSDVINISASTSIDSLVVYNIPTWAYPRQYGSVVASARGGAFMLSHSSSNAVTQAYYWWEQNSFEIISPFWHTANNDLSGPRITLYPFSLSYLAPA